MKDNGGATAIEYALVGTFVSIIIVASLKSMGSTLSGFFNSVASGLR